MLTLDSVSKTYRTDGHAVVALSHVSLTLPFHGLTVIAGRNGSGKSTLLDIIAGSVAPDMGRVVFEGHDISSLPDFRRQFIGRLFQNAQSGTCLDLTVEENLSIALMGKTARLTRLAESHNKRRKVLHAIKTFAPGAGLEARLWERVGNLSGGELQILNILFLILRQPCPGLIVADEPTSNLDPDNTRRCITLLHQLSQQRGVAMVTHDEQALSHADRLVILHKGCVVGEYKGCDIAQVQPMEVIRKYELSTL
jgi:putative ABC transport system ATP-binding protein